MADLSSDRVLQRLVAKLSRARSEDIIAVLDELDEPQRRTVQTMLSAHGDRPSSARSASISPLLLDGLSPWLNERLADGSARPNAHSIAGASPAMTKAARQALCEAAAEMLRLGLALPATAAKPNNPSLINNFFGFVSGRGLR